MTTPVVEQRIVKSRDRVRAYGEVFTPRCMVDQMLDLVSDDLEDGPDFVDKTFLEPAAGDGNFLVAILQRKLQAVEKRLSPDAWADESLFALASIYGIELLEDNHEEARAAMLAEFVGFHSRHDAALSPDSTVVRAARFLIDTNIVRGNTLTGLDWLGEGIQFSWWNRVAHSPGIVQREPFSLASLRESSGFDFTVYETYAACPIDRIHEEVRAGA
ncbi:hypothetical protein NS220_02435 [Microbacterium testaceum]|uniref:Methylase n=1 Tax=Microbacterium testaceum TaxID=2033 RepID=A0A147F0P2_MICTE|nr:hypothetical protein [Microbacterium testaceum]KTR96384.1 hypothetical protein NS220_02435 [Microbacterium testaceum]